MRFTKKLFLLIVPVFLVSGCNLIFLKQDHTKEILDSTVTVAKIQEVVKLLSHPVLEGRKTGSVGYEFTRDFLARELRRAGFEVAVQEFPIGLWKEAPISWNVIGYLPGTVRDSSAVIFSAHADGHNISSSKGVYFGADDNASGVAGILAIAHAFGGLKESGVSLKRSIIICFFGAEEDGKQGSLYFVGSDYFRKIKPVAVINFDMVGRGGKDSVSVMGSLADEEFQSKSPTLFGMVHDLNRSFGFTIIDPDTTRRWDPFDSTDSWRFYEVGVPVLFFFTGFHSDYHQTTDIPDKLDYEKLEKISRFAFVIGLRLARGDIWPVFITN